MPSAQNNLYANWLIQGPYTSLPHTPPLEQLKLDTIAAARTTAAATMKHIGTGKEYKPPLWRK